MTALEIQKSILTDAYKRQAFTCPNYAPNNWWECDVFEFTKTGVFVEYEIKLSKADFRADRFKTETKYRLIDGQWQDLRRNKHDLLAGRCTDGPSRFWFVCPEGVLSVEDMPEWAGLIHAKKTRWRNSPVLEKIKQAPLLHREKLNEKIRNHMLRTYYHRYQRWFLLEKQS